MRAALCAVLVAVATHTRADQDLFGNIRFGGDVIAARSAVLVDTYSFTGTGTFTNHEWLFEALAYLAFSGFGTGGLMALKIALIAVMVLAVSRALHLAGVASFDADVLVAIVVVATFPQTNQVRAQLFSLALFACVLLVLLTSRRSAPALAWLVPIMVLWPNVHGGWIVAAGTLGVWSGLAVIAHVRSRAAWTTAGAAAAALLATAANPWGWRMWTFLYETVHLDRADIRDWQPVFRLGPMYGALWLGVAAVAIAGFVEHRRRRTVDIQSAAVVLMLGVASFRVNRLLSFFAIAAVMSFGPDLMAWQARRRTSAAAFAPSRLAGAAAAATALAVVLLAATVSARNAACIRMEPASFTEPELTALVRQHRLAGRMLTYFDYGHYAIWYFTPAIKISMDPRRETMYSREMIDRHLRFYFSPEDRQATIALLQPDYIWLPSNLPVTARLVEDGWHPLFAGPRSTLLSREPDAAGTPSANAGQPGAGSGADAPRCFPGP